MKKLILITILITAGTVAAVGQIPESERQALIDFYYGTGGHNWSSTDNWLGDPGTECTWDGVGCNGEGTHVIYFFPIGNNLVGTIPKSLAGLSFLEELELFDNKLSGEIPAEIGQLIYLTQIDAHYNQLSGNLPPALGNLYNLKYLYLNNNQLSGEIPSELAALPVLEELDLHTNNLTSLPGEIGKCPNLNYLDASDNYIQGEIPLGLCESESLVYLNLNLNGLQGEMPAEIGNLTNLTLLGLGCNQLIGEVPKSITKLVNIPDPGYYGFPPRYTWFLDISCNALYTDDPDVIAYIDRKFPFGYNYFQNLQTVAPKNVSFKATGQNTGALSWEPIAYQRESGGYEIYRATLPGGPYTLLDIVPDKAASSFNVQGLNPGTTYFLAIRSYTDPSQVNRNKVFSEFSSEVVVGPPFTAASISAAHAASTSVWQTVVYLTNTGDTPADLTLQALDPAGRAVEAVTVPALPPHGSFQADLAAVFSPETLAQNVWFKVWSGGTVKGLLAFGTRDGQAEAVMPLANGASPSLVFPYVYSGQDYYTGITLVNPSGLRAHTHVTSFDETGQPLGAVDISIPARGKYVRLVDQIVGLGDPQRVRLLTVESDQPLAGFELFGSFAAGGLAGLPAFAPPAAQAIPVSSPGAENLQTADGAGSLFLIYYNAIPDPSQYFTGVTFSNFGAGAATVTAELHAGSGALLAQRVWQVGSMEQVTREVWSIFDGTQFPDAAYMKAEAATPLLGFELFLTRADVPSPFRFDGLAGVAAGSAGLCFPMARPDSSWTSVLRLTNPAAATASFSVYAFLADGAPAGTFAQSIPGQGQSEYTLEAMFSGMAHDVAWFEVESQTPLIGSVLCVSADLTRMVSYIGF